METITLTFGDCAENHRGMQEIGEKATQGLKLDDLKSIKEFFEKSGRNCELTEIHNIKDAPEDASEAYLLVVRNGVETFVDKSVLMEEQMSLERDKKAFMYGRVVNKKARHNLCFSDFDQAPDYEHKKGTVVSFERLPLLATIREALGKLNKKLTLLQCEGNYYYNIKKCFIGFHGDTERRIVVAVRLGASFPLKYQWFQNNKAVGEMFTCILNDGDMYFMSEKAVGFDWKKRKSSTLRHAAFDKKTM